MKTPLGFGRISSDAILLAAATMAAAIIGITAWLLFGRSTKEPTIAKPPRAVIYTRVVCPACERELPYDPALDGQVCTSCNAGASLVAARSPEAEALGGKAWGRAVVLLSVVSTVLPGFVLIARSRVRSLRRSVDAEKHRKALVRCPFCERKVRYSALRAGSGIICARCKTSFMLPELVQ
jgi:hypothetical protein